MTEAEKIKQVLFQFEDAGLVSKDIEMALACVADNILGIGIGEQGFVTSKDDMRHVFWEGLKGEDPYSHRVRYGRIEVLQHAETFATVCAEVILESSEPSGQQISESRFFQLLTLMKLQQDWKVCALHASTPVVTEETLEAYPLKFAEKTLQSLKARIGEQAYQAEEQFRQAILSDTIAFYYLNFSKDIVEKCQCNSDLCVVAQEGDSYQKLLVEGTPRYVAQVDRAKFVDIFSSGHIRQAFEQGQQEISFEYRLNSGSGQHVWALTVVRLIPDVESGDLKGIMYVRNIDQKKRDELALRNKAIYDGMTQLYNKEAAIQTIGHLLHENFGGGFFVMLDIDSFKQINDTYGHPVGDLVLIETANVLKDAFCEPCVVGRLGGDEFGVFIPGAVQEQVRCRLQLLLEKLERIRLLQAPALTVSCSIGAVGCPHGASFAELYDGADSALYHAKKNGKNQVCIR